MPRLFAHSMIEPTNGKGWHDQAGGDKGIRAIADGDAANADNWLARTFRKVSNNNETPIVNRKNDFCYCSPLEKRSGGYTAFAYLIIQFKKTAPQRGLPSKKNQGKSLQFAASLIVCG